VTKQRIATCRQAQIAEQRRWGREGGRERLEGEGRRGMRGVVEEGREEEVVMVV